MLIVKAVRSLMDCISTASVVTALIEMNFIMDKRLSSNILRCYLSQPTKLKFIGGGTKGNAYLIGDRVFKVTEDFSDFDIAVILKNKPHKLFAKVYNCEAVEYRGRNYFIIESSYEGLTAKKNFGEPSLEVEIIESISNNLADSYFYGYKRHSLKDLIEEFCLDGTNKEIKDFVKSIYDAYTTLATFVRKHRLKCFDYHSDNVCLHNTNIKVIDFGFSGYNKEIPNKYNFKKIK